jgi:anti-anti-sigma factor
VDIEVVRAADGVRLSLVGELDFTSVAEASRRIALIDMSGAAAVDVDLSRLVFCDSSGLRMLVVLRQRCIDAGVPFAVSGARGMVAKTIAVSGLREAFSCPPR